MVEEVPKQVSDAGLEEWYSGLSPQDRVRTRRYLDGIDSSSEVAFLNDLMARAAEDSNYRLAVTAGNRLESMDLDDYDRFESTERMIEGLFGSDQFEEAKRLCCRNLELYPAVASRISEGGSVPHLSCRNRLIDILVGVEGDYDSAYAVLDEYLAMGLIDEEERDYRRQSLKVHRMQRSFDNIFNLKKS